MKTVTKTKNKNNKSTTKTNKKEQNNKNNKENNNNTAIPSSGRHEHDREHRWQEQYFT